MEAAKHTPGPWRRSTGSDRWIVQERGGCIACVEQDRTVGEGNVQLIAEAPEMLRLLRALADRRNEDHCSTWGEWDAVLELIARAPRSAT